MNKTDTQNPETSRARSILPWLVPPVLAVIAFFPVVGMWFVADDFGHLLFNNRLPFPQPLLAFGDNALFYRPFSTVLTWNLGTAIFGRDATPYHVISLLFHALSAFLLARAVYVISSSKVTGILAGSLFAVYPLITEPVAWLASQWDVLGMSCLLGAVLGFAVAWRNSLEGTPWRLPYALGLISAFLAVGMKESTLPLPLVLPFVALAISEIKSEKQPGTTGGRTRITSFARYIGRSLPYALPSLLFVSLRLIGSGRLGGYSDAPTDIQNFFWDNMVKSFLAMLMPLNRLLFGDTTSQVVGLGMTALFFGMLILWGRQKWPMLLLALAWWLVFIAPVLNLITGGEDPAHIGNRLFYLSLAGFCMALATLLSVPLESQQQRVQQFAWVAVVAALLIAVPVTWKHLEPWTQASRQTRQIVDELTSMLPPRNDGFIEINAHSLPREYDGAYVFWNGLDSAIQVFHRQHVNLVDANGLDSQALVAPLNGHTARWNLDFAFDPGDELFYVDGLSGIAENGDPPGTAGTRLWDFRGCTDGGRPPGGLQTTNAATKCAQGYLDFVPDNNDPAMILPDLNIALTAARWLRVGVAIRYDPSTGPHQAEWYWAGADKQLSEQKSTRYYLSNGAQWQVYWTFIRADRIGPSLGNLRFDPVNEKLNAEIGWIAVTPVEK